MNESKIKINSIEINTYSIDNDAISIEINTNSIENKTIRIGE